MDYLEIKIQIHDYLAKKRSHRIFIAQLFDFASFPKKAKKALKKLYFIIINISFLHYKYLCHFTPLKFLK